MLKSTRRLKKAVCASILLLAFCLGRAPVAQANFDQHEHTSEEECEVDVTTYKVNRIVDCLTGAFIRFELIEFTESTRYYTRYYCDGGTGACETSDPLCVTAEDIFQTISVFCEG
jgi:hypothetical protein